MLSSMFCVRVVPCHRHANQRYHSLRKKKLGRIRRVVYAEKTSCGSGRIDHEPEGCKACSTTEKILSLRRRRRQVRSGNTMHSAYRIKNQLCLPQTRQGHTTWKKMTHQWAQIIRHPRSYNLRLQKPSFHDNSSNTVDTWSGPKRYTFSQTVTKVVSTARDCRNRVCGRRVWTEF